MLAPSTVRRLAAALPHVDDKSTDARLAFEVAGKGFAWSWNERVGPKKPRVPNLNVLAVRVPAEFKDIILEADPGRYQHDPHYDGFPAVLIKLDSIGEAELAAMLANAWRCMAPKTLLTPSAP